MLDRPDWRARVLTASRGTLTGAIVACALDEDREALPRFEGGPSITSDGFIICNFVTRHGDRHMGAFVGSARDLAANLERLIAHCKLTRREALELRDALKAWVNR